MSQVLNKRVTSLIPEETIYEVASNYRAKQLLTGRQPQIRKLFMQSGVNHNTYERVVGLLGGTKCLHEFMSREIELTSDDFTALLKDTIGELLGRVSKMNNQELINLASVLAKLQTGPAATQVNTQINFDIDRHLADRIADAEIE